MEAVTRMHQGRCSFPIIDSDRILDRLAGLEQVIHPDDIQQALEATGRVNSRACTLTHQVTLWVVLAMGLFTDLPIRQVYKYARRLRKGESTPHRSSLCVARQRLGVDPLRQLFAQIVRPLANPHTKGAFYGGYRLMGIDSTVLDVPDTPANEAAFGRSSGSRGDGAFPQIRKLSLVELGTHVEVAISIGPVHCSEQKMVSDVLPYVTPEMLLLVDRGFYSCEFWRELDSMKVKLLARVINHVALAPLRYLSDGSYLTKIYRNQYDRKKDRDGVWVRVIRYTLDDPQRVGHGEVHTIITNLLDEKLYPADELIILYHERWEHELVYDEQKTHQDPRRATKPSHLRSETPDGVKQELYALSLGHFVIRSLMFSAAESVDIDPDRLSFTGCFQILKCRLPECDGLTAQSITAWYEALLWEMQSERTDPRRNRINPRVIKQKISKWNKKRPVHLRQPPLKKTFRETIVMTH